MPISKSAETREIDDEDAGQRLDNYLTKHLKGLPRARIYRCIRRGEVRVNGGRARPARKLAQGDLVRIPPVAHLPDPSASPVPASFMDLTERICFQHEGLIVLDKPAGLASHGGSGISAGAIETLRANMPEARHLALVHRLDRATSGCLMIARKRSYLRLLQDALRQRKLGKHYLAVVHGTDIKEQLIDAPLLTRASGQGEKFTSVNPTGKPAQTRIKVLQTQAGLTLLEAELLTGRTHQIRVHLRHLRHPIVGDEKYGDRLRDEVALSSDGPSTKQPGLFLHAWRLRLPALDDWPAVDVHAPVPDDWHSHLKHGFDLLVNK